MNIKFVEIYLVMNNCVVIESEGALNWNKVSIFGVCSDKENLCLYGHPNESWEVTLPAEEVPPELPEPALGINFARDGMNRKDWLSLVAVHTDSWLLSVAFYLGARLNRNERYISSLFYDLATDLRKFWLGLGWHWSFHW